MVRLKELGNHEQVRRAAFQFHYGTIKRFARRGKLTGLSHFNSTMVRLKDPIGYAVVEVTTEFQFHYGTIKSCQPVRHPVRKGISIPLWYD